MKNWSKYAKPERSQRSNQVNIESGMTCEQKFHSITESVMTNINHTKVETLKGCEMHPKISKKCRKCNQIEKNMNLAQIKKEEALNLSESFAEIIKLNVNNLKTHFNQKLIKNIEDSYVFKTQIKTLVTVKDLTAFLTPDEISINAYVTGSNDTPTNFMMIFYRLVQLRPTRQQLTIMIRSNNVNVRCLAMLYLRVFIDPVDVYGCLAPSFKENKILFATMTIGEYAMRLFNEEQLNHGGFRLPRLPIRIQKQIERRINLYQQNSHLKRIMRERSRSRQKYQDDEVNEGRLKHQPDEQEAEIKQELKEIKVEPQKVLSLKQRIALLQQKNEAERKRRAILQQYKSQNVNKLESDGEGEDYEQNDEVEKYKMG